MRTPFVPLAVAAFLLPMAAKAEAKFELAFKPAEDIQAQCVEIIRRDVVSGFYDDTITRLTLTDSSMATVDNKTRVVVGNGMAMARNGKEVEMEYHCSIAASGRAINGAVVPRGRLRSVYPNLVR